MYQCIYPPKAIHTSVWYVSANTSALWFFFLPIPDGQEVHRWAVKLNPDISGETPTAPQGQHKSSTECFRTFIVAPLQRSRGPNHLLSSCFYTHPSASTQKMGLGTVWENTCWSKQCQAHRDSSQLQFGVSPGLSPFCWGMAVPPAAKRGFLHSHIFLAASSSMTAPLNRSLTGIPEEMSWQIAVAAGGADSCCSLSASTERRQHNSTSEGFSFPPEWEGAWHPLCHLHLLEHTGWVWVGVLSVTDLIN